MEAFALHKVCQHHDTNFDCYKYVTDSTDEEASTDWVENVAKGAELFIDILDSKYGKSSL